MTEENTPDKFQPAQDDDNTLDYEVNEDEIKLLNERRQHRLTGKSETYLWEEAKKIITRSKQA